MKFGVVVFPGSNRDHDAWYAVTKILGQDCEIIWHDATNLGNVDLPATDARHRLFALTALATPIGVTAIEPAAGVQQSVPAGQSTIVEFHWNPGAVSAGTRLFVLAISDDQTNTPVSVPATFATLDDLEGFCAANPGAAYRTFTVSA